MDKMKKRGQVTVFIILGILIIVALGIVLYLNQFALKTSFEREQEKISVTQEFIPVKNYFDSCIKSIALEGANTLALQGGYINIPQDNLPVNPILPFSNRLQVFGNDALEVPYWFYETANGIQKTQIPSKQDMENELENYISSNLNNCLNNFTEFQDYEISGFNNVKTEVIINNENVFIKVLSKLSVEHKDLTQEFDKFLITLDVPLGKLYNKAKEILDIENKNNFFEELTYDMMVVYEEIPLSKTEFSCEQRIWSEEQVKKDFKKIVSKNINAVNLQNTNTRKYYSLPINSEDIQATFSYSENWPFYMQVFPSENGVLKGDEIIKQTGALRFLSAFLCLNNYHFIYDVKYPVLITLNKDGLIFQFAQHIILDNNQPKKNLLGTRDPVTSFSLCDKKITKTTISTFTVDDEDNLVPLDDVKVLYKCFTNTCDIGITKLENGNAVLEENFPQCINGLATGEKDGYYKGTAFASTNQESSVSLVLEPFYEKDLEIKLTDKHNGGIRNLLEKEQVLIRFNSLDNDYSFVITYPEINNINLIPGNYKVSTYVMKESSKGINIQGGEIENCVSVPKGGLLGLFFDETKCVKTTLESFVLDQALIGGTEFEFEIKRNDLVNSNKLILYIIFDKIPETNEDILKINDAISINKNNQYFKYPEFRK